MHELGTIGPICTGMGGPVWLETTAAAPELCALGASTMVTVRVHETSHGDTSHAWDTLVACSVDETTSTEPRRNMRPKIAAKNTWARIEALQRDRQFVADYRVARTAWLAGLPAVFPAGTYWLQRFAGVTVAPLPT